MLLDSSNTDALSQRRYTYFENKAKQPQQMKSFLGLSNNLEPALASASHHHKR